MRTYPTCLACLTACLYVLKQLALKISLEMPLTVTVVFESSVLRQLSCRTHDQTAITPITRNHVAVGIRMGGGSVLQLRCI